MEKTIGTRIRECRVKMGMTQEELAEALLTKKSTISAYENDKIDIKISILKQIAALLGTTVAYLADGEKTEIGEDVMQVVLLLQGMQNEELRKVAIAQVKLLAGVK
ncbi:MAG: helix-turn-helix domain-containing protein [Suilimivivens sp.]